MKRILLHISDRDKWLQLFNQLKPMQAEGARDRWEIVVVADVFAGAVCIACNKSLREQMMDFVAAGHTILACEESLRCLNIRPESLPDFVRPIPNGIIEVVDRQAEGFCYIKV